MDSLTREQSLSPVSDDVVKICRDGLDYPDWPSSPAPPNLNDRNKGRWAAVIRDSSYVLPNINWGNFFWRATDRNNKMHMLGLKTENGTKEMAVFWVTGPITQA